MAASRKRNFNGGFTAMSSERASSRPDPKLSDDVFKPLGSLPILKLPFPEVRLGRQLGLSGQLPAQSKMAGSENRPAFGNLMG